MTVVPVRSPGLHRRGPARGRRRGRRGWKVWRHRWPRFLTSTIRRAGQRVDHRDADAVQAAGDLVAAAAELAAGVQHRSAPSSARACSSAGVRVGGDAAAVVVDPDAAVGLQGHHDPVAVARPAPRRRALSTISQTRWCRPRSPVEPMYMPGRLRTASRPSRTWIEARVVVGDRWALRGRRGGSDGVEAGRRAERGWSRRTHAPLPDRGTPRPLEATRARQLTCGGPLLGGAVRPDVHDTRSEASDHAGRPWERGICGQNMALSGPDEGGSRRRTGGSDGSPYRPLQARQIGSSARLRSPVEARPLSRRCRADRGRRGPASRPFFQLGPVRAEHLDHGDGAVAELLVEPAYDGRARAAGAGWPRRSSRCAPPAGRRRRTPGVQCVGDLGADQLGPAGEDAAAPAGRAPSRGRRPAGRRWCRAAGGRGRRDGRR